MAISLRNLLIIPFVLQVVGITGLVGYLSHRSGQQAVQDLASQLMAEMGQRLEANLAIYLNVPQTLTRMNAQIMLDPIPGIDHLQHLEAHFLQQLQSFPEVTGVSITTPSGHFLDVSRLPSGNTIIRHLNVTQNDNILYRYQGDAQGENRRLLETSQGYHPHYNLPDASWYGRSQAAAEDFWQIVVALHEGPSRPLLAMVRVKPIDTPEGERKGVSSVGVLLPELSQFLKTVMEERKGQVLLLETNGDMVATSTGETTFLTAVMDDLPPDAPAHYRQLAWYQSDNRLTRAVVQHLVTQHGRLNHIQEAAFYRLQVGSQIYFIHVSPLEEELGWLLITVMPSQEFMGTISANLARTVLLCTLALAGSIGLGIWTAETLTKPILALQQATASFSEDTTPLPPSQPSPSQEVEALRQQFDHMVRQLVHSLETLQHREDTLATFLNGIPVAVSVHATDGHILFLNHRGHALLPAGILPSQLDDLPEDYRVYVAGTDDLYPVDDLPVTKGLRGETVYTDDLEIDVEGQRVPLEVHTIPVFNEQGEVRYCITAFQDISERRQAEALRANYERELEQRVAEQTASIAQGEVTKQALINAIPDLLMRLGRGGIPLEIYNLDAITWIRDKNPLNLQAIYAHLPPTIAAERQQCIEVALATGTIQRQEYELTVGGHPYWEEARIIPVTEDEVLVVVRDMSERHKIDRLKDEFIAMVSHELRTPLTAIRGALGILDSGILHDRPDKARHMLTLSLSNTDRLIRLVNDILDLERLSSGKVQLVRQDCTVEDLMALAIEGVEALALAANITLHPTPLQATVWADPDPIVQTLVNLLSNAIKFSPSGSRIWLRAEQHPNTVRFAVIDQGRGIPADQCEVIFDRFQQVDVSDSQHRGGTGLGLAICKNIVTQHGGDIWVESIFGAGSTFYFTLPTRAHG